MDKIKYGHGCRGRTRDSLYDANGPPEDSLGHCMGPPGNILERANGPPVTMIGRAGPGIVFHFPWKPAGCKTKRERKNIALKMRGERNYGIKSLRIKYITV